MLEFLGQFIPVLRWQDVLDILIVAFLIYRVILLIRGTRAVQMAAGLAVIIVVYFAARQLELFTLHWMLGTILSSLFLVIIIVFQDDIRRALTQMGQTPFLKARVKTFHALEEIAKAAATLMEARTGALIVLEREVGLGNYLESGVEIDGRVTRALLCSIFFKGSPLHDGAVIIQKGRLSVAACVLPLTTNPNISTRLGTRHRSAIGITEQTDAVSVVISEETGSLSVAIAGRITRDIDLGTLRRILHNTFAAEEAEKPWWKRRIL
ncbi:MAG TPA: TIGR00159 family protein [Thermodesulfobacteriaceae bacterium]|nr:TIGR00159 family protein [Thermodesulfobacteriaceae bacterium]